MERPRPNPTSLPPGDGGAGTTASGTNKAAASGGSKATTCSWIRSPFLRPRTGWRRIRGRRSASARPPYISDSTSDPCWRAKTPDDARAVVFFRGWSGLLSREAAVALRFSCGDRGRWVSRPEDDTITAIAGPERLVLRQPPSLYGEDLKTLAEFTVDPGQSIPFVL